MKYVTWELDGSLMKYEQTFSETLMDDTPYFPFLEELEKYWDIEVLRQQYPYLFCLLNLAD